VGKHRLRTPRARVSLHRTTDVNVVDMASGIIHLLTLEAITAGSDRKGRYTARCGTTVHPAQPADPGCDYCWSCRSVIPRQRSGS
jgi:hypothetical protein